MKLNTSSIVGAPAASGLLGHPRGLQWTATPTHVDMSAPLPPPRPLTVTAAPQTVTIDLNRTALVIIDMQNDFCAPGGWVDHLGADYTPDRAPIAPLQTLLPPLRGPGCRWSGSTGATGPTWATCRPTSSTSTSPRGPASASAIRCPARARPSCRRTAGRPRSSTSWSGARGHLRVDKYRISGFWDTPLDSILRNLRRAHGALRRRQHRPVRALHAAGRELPRLRLRAGRGLLRHHFARLSARRRRCSTSRSASGSSPTRRRSSRPSTPDRRVDHRRVGATSSAIATMTTTQIALLTLMMLLTGAVGAITGGNSLINVPLMITIGMPPRQAVATNMFAVIFMTVSATARFARAGVLRWHLLAPLGVDHAVTSALGAVIAVKLPETVVKLVVGISMGGAGGVHRPPPQGATAADARPPRRRLRRGRRCSASTAASSRAATPP